MFIFLSINKWETEKKNCRQVCREYCQSYRLPQQITWHGNSFGVFNICTDFLMPSPPATTRQQSPVCSKEISYMRVSLINRTVCCTQTVWSISLPTRNYRCSLHTRQVTTSQHDPWPCREVYVNRKEDMNYKIGKKEGRKNEREDPPYPTMLADISRTAQGCRLSRRIPNPISKGVTHTSSFLRRY